MDATAQATVYLIHAWIRGIHLMLWRWFLVRSDRTMADLPFFIQIGFGWTTFHLHRFRIRRKSDTVLRIGMKLGLARFCMLAITGDDGTEIRR